MNIVLSNGWLSSYGGTELWTLTMYNYLKRHHNISIYNKMPGPIKKYFNNSILTSASDVKWWEPDLIIGAHWHTLRDLEGIAPIIMVSHSFFLQPERFHAGADAYVAVSEEVADVEKMRGYDPYIIRNPIDIDTYFPRTSPRKKLEKVLYMSHDGGRAGPIIKEACKDAGLKYIQIPGTTPDLSIYMNEADLCIGIGRCLMEAMACGRNVISGDWRSWMVAFTGHGFLHPSEIEGNIYDNYSNRRTQNHITKDDLLKYFKMYDADLCWDYVEKMRGYHSVDKIANQFMEVYGQISEPIPETSR